MFMNMLNAKKVNVMRDVLFTDGSAPSTLGVGSGSALTPAEGATAGDRRESAKGEP